MGTREHPSRDLGDTACHVDPEARPYGLERVQGMGNALVDDKDCTTRLASVASLQEILSGLDDLPAPGCTP